MTSATQETRFDWVAFAAIATTIVAWASAFAAIRVCLPVVPPVELAGARYGLGAVFAALYLIVSRQKLPSRSDFIRLVVIGFLFVTLYAVLLNTGELTVPAGPASFIINTAPIFVALLAMVFLGERFGLWGWIGTAVCMTGVGLIAYGEGEGFGLNLGALAILTAAICAAIASILQKPLLTRMPPLVVTAWVLIFGALPFVFAGPGIVTSMQAAPANVIAAIVYMAIVPTAIGYLTFAIALRRLSASRTTNFLYGVPPTATLIGFVWLNEVPTTFGIVGAGLAIFGVVIVNTMRSKGAIAPQLKPTP